MSDTAIRTGTIRTRIPARLDRLPWARFHWMVILGLGTAWVLDGLEVTVVGAVAARLTEAGSGVSMSAGDIGTAAAIYVVGACTGALVFGQLTDRLGRKKMFIITLLVYLVATALTAVSWTAWFFFVMRFFTGAGIGGEYAAVNSAIDELIPARARGRVDLIVNGSYWIGSIGGSAAALLFLDTSLFAKNLGWRLAFLLGVILAIAVMLVRKGVPESPRWLFIHGREQEAERLVDGIERDIADRIGERLEPVQRTLTVRQRKAIPFREIARVAFRRYPRRSILCLALFVGQAFIYNAITFNLGTLMSTFFGVASATVPIFIIVYAASNFVGPLVLGRLFDTVGRKPMISGTYLGSATIAAVLAILLVSTSVLGAWTFIAIVMATFFLASAGASAAYLTASEIFPMETRALAIAFFYAVGTAIGGITGPLLFGHLIGSKQISLVSVAFFIGAGVMALGGVAELVLGVKAEGAQLEDIAEPLTVADADHGGEGGAADDRASDGRGDPPEITRARARAAEERARAADHRAAAHERPATAGAAGEPAASRAEVELRLAEAADAAALAQDEYALAAEQRAAAERAGSRYAAVAALHRAAAADQRAHAHEHDAVALTAGTESDAERHRLRSAAALERSRACEQRAFAAEARAGSAGSAGSAEVGSADAGSAQTAEADPGSARARMHQSLARMHDLLADAQDRAGADDAAGAAAARTRARACEEAARAQGYRAEAAEHRAEAAGYAVDGTEPADEEARRSERSAEQRRAARDERVRSRLERRRARERSGLRRFRPGPGPSSRSPAVLGPAPPAEEALDSEIRAIGRALAEHGQTERRQLAELVGARYWGPGVFRQALRIAVQDGDVRRVSRTGYAPREQDRSG